MNRQNTYSVATVYNTNGAGLVAMFLAVFLSMWLCVSVAEAPAQNSLSAFDMTYSQGLEATRLRANAIEVKTAVKSTQSHTPVASVIRNSAVHDLQPVESDLFSAPAQCNMLTRTCEGVH